LLHPPVSDAEKARLLRLLAGLRLINPDNQIAAAYSDLLSRMDICEYIWLMR
jgi:hypothetical protein